MRHLNLKHYPNPKTIPLISNFISRIVQAGRGQQALTFIDLEVRDYVRKIEEHSQSGGKITPTVFNIYREKENFWVDELIGQSIDKEEAEKEYEKEEVKGTRHLLEIDRLHLFRMREMYKNLFVAQERFQISKPFNSDPQKNSQNNDLVAENTSKVSVADLKKETTSHTSNDTPKPVTPENKNEGYNFYTVFRDDAKALNLIKLLQIKEVINSSKKWLLPPTNIILLARELSNNSHIVKVHKVATLGKILCQEFGLGIDPLPFDYSMFNKKAKNSELIYEFKSIIGNL